MNFPIAGPRAKKRLTCLTATSLLALSLAGCLGYDGDVQHGYQMDQQSLAEVKPGQTAEQVLVTLGTPSTTSTVGGDAWYYMQQRTERPVAFMQPSLQDQRVYAVYFDKTKRVTRIATYGMKDGRVVAFAAGATPTIGGDNSLIKSMFLNFNPFGSQFGGSNASAAPQSGGGS
jgi:outer membrane protein assembly factor BamE (lipoprotein component of BamABCDE complex)